MILKTTVCIFLCLVIDINGKRYGGGGSRRISASRPSSPPYHPPARPPARPPAHPPAVYHPPSPSPSITNHGSGTVRPIGFVTPKTQPIGPPGHNPTGGGTVRPIGFDPPGHHGNSGKEIPKHSTPVGNAPPPYSPGGGTAREIGFVPPGQHGSPGKPIDTPKHSTSLGNAPPPYNPGNYGHNPPPYNPHYNPSGHGAPPAYTPMGHSSSNPAGYGPPPAYTPMGHSSSNPAGYGPPPVYSHGNYQGGYHPQGNTYPQGGYHPQSGYHPQGGYYSQSGYHPHAGGVTVINNNVNNHHYNGYSGYGGYGYSPPVYTTHDTGNTALGFFLGYSLAKISTPSYHYHNSYYDGYGPRYDHYTIHHYYHNKETVPKEAAIEPNAIVGCVGDSGSFCPSNTTSLCTSNGAVMCVASAMSTVPCSNEKKTDCVRSVVPCKENNSTECKQSSADTTSIMIPCISTAKIYGSITYVNNTIVIANTTANNNSNNTLSQNETVNSNMTTSSSFNATSNSNVTLPTSSGSNGSNNTTVAANATNTEKGPPQMFCVTVLALPAERKLTEGEKLFNGAKEIFSEFTVKAFGLD